MIDTHLHIGQLYYNEKALTPEYLLNFMDKGGIDRAVLLPIESPECTTYYVSTDYVLEICAQYPDRFLPFCNVDPRRTRVHEAILDYRQKGCLGYGEAMSGLQVDDPQLQVVYKACGEAKMPVLFDFDARMNLDDPGLPRFESMLEAFSETAFIGHGPFFWAEISGGFNRDPANFYPPGPVLPGGAVPRLLRRYPNLYADISAGSGYNALTRDPEYGFAFLDEFQDKLLFGTDLCHYDQKIPHMDFFRGIRDQKKISAEVFAKIADQNAEKLLGV